MAAAIVVWTCAAAMAQERTPPTKGPAEARARFEVFLDFGDDTSGRIAVVLDELLAKHPTAVQVTFRHLPAENDREAALPHRGAIAAERQDKFWDMARVLFANQGHHTRQDLIGIATQLRLDVEKFTADLADPAVDDELAADRAAAATVKAVRAPVVRLNGTTITGEYTVTRFEALIAGRGAATSSETR